MRRFLLVLVLTFCSSLAFAQGFRRPDPARPVGRPAAPPRDARPVDIFAGIRNAENTALGLQREVQDLKQRIHECADREMERIAQAQQAEEQIARNPRGLLGRAADFFRGRRGPERPRAAARPELQGGHRCEFLGGLFHPVMNATDVVLIHEPPDL